MFSDINFQLNIKSYDKVCLGEWEWRFSFIAKHWQFYTQGFIIFFQIKNLFIYLEQLNGYLFYFSGFKRKEFRGKLAIAITANFINRRTEAEARVEEISGVAFIFNQKFFKDLYAATGIDLENIVYYKDDTHYFVMTAKKHSLLDKGVIIQVSFFFRNVVLMFCPWMTTTQCLRG